MWLSDCYSYFLGNYIPSYGHANKFKNFHFIHRSCIKCQISTYHPAVSLLFILSSSAPVPFDKVHTAADTPWRPSHHTLSLQCGICCGYLSLKQSWRRAERANSSSRRYPEPPYRPGCKEQMLRKDRCRSRHSSRTHLNSILTIQRTRCTVWLRPEAVSWSQLTGMPWLRRLVYGSLKRDLKLKMATGSIHKQEVPGYDHSSYM